jgi:hypothetical protein
LLQAAHETILREADFNSLSFFKGLRFSKEKQRKRSAPLPLTRIFAFARPLLGTSSSESAWLLACFDLRSKTPIAVSLVATERQGELEGFFLLEDIANRFGTPKVGLPRR